MSEFRHLPKIPDHLDISKHFDLCEYVWGLLDERDAEIARLQEVLDRIERWSDGVEESNQDAHHMADIAREALASRIREPQE